MATSSVTSSIVSTLGGGSGIDMAALAQNLAAAQFAARIDRNTTRSETVTAQISAASTLKAQVLAVASSVGARVRNGDISTQPSIANAAVAAVSRGAASGSGSYTLEVAALASQQVLTSPAYASAASPVGSGTLTLKFGTIAGTGFAEDSAHAAVPIVIEAGATLADVASAINAAGAGVTAYVAQGSAGAQLVLKGASGAANGFTLEASGDAELAALGWTPAGDGSRLLASAASASFKLDGVAMTSASNTIENVAPGLTLKLTGTNAGTPTTIAFSDPSSAVTSFMEDLTSALNELVATLNADVDPKSGELARDSGARALRRALSQLAGATVMPDAAGAAPRTLADLGLSTQRDGTFALDSSRLATALAASPSGVAAMFTTGLNGVYATIDKLSRTATAASDPGSLAGSLARLATQQTALASEKTTLAEKQEAVRQQLVSRYAALDTRLAASKSTLSFLQAQIDAWNAAGSD